MRNRERHRNKFLRELGDIEELRREGRRRKRKVEERWWCTREGAKEVIDDLTEHLLSQMF